MFEIDSLSVAYGERRVLDSIHMRLAAGSVTAVIGPNGVGKSTLLRAVSGVIPPTSGCARVNGHDLAHMSPTERACQIAVVPQAISLPAAFTAWETVLMGRTPHLNWLGQVSRRDEEIARHAMRRTHTLELAERRVGELSGGEQQRLLLARALAQAAPILLMDEPTSHLDLQYQISLLEEVRSLARQEGLTVLAVLHDLNLVARFADQVGLLLNGRLEAFGRPQEVLTANLLTRAYHVPLQVMPVGKASVPFVIPLTQ